MADFACRKSKKRCIWEDVVHEDFVISEMALRMKNEVRKLLIHDFFYEKPVRREPICTNSKHITEELRCYLSR